jgi:hypothetical protein
MATCNVQHREYDTRHHNLPSSSAQDAANLDELKTAFQRFFKICEGIKRILMTRTRGTKGTGQTSHGLDCGMNGGTETSTLGSSRK